VQFGIASIWRPAIVAAAFRSMIILSRVVDVLINVIITNEIDIN